MVENNERQLDTVRVGGDSHPHLCLLPKRATSKQTVLVTWNACRIKRLKGSSALLCFLCITQITPSCSFFATPIIATTSSTMQPSTRVFGLPELACIIASQLDKKALTCLMLTSRGMHAAI